MKIGLNKRGKEVCIWNIGDLLGSHAAITKYHKLIGLNSRSSFLTVLESRKPKVKGLADLVPSGNPLPSGFADNHLLAKSLHREARESHRM